MVSKKILGLKALVSAVKKEKKSGRKIVFTNGCFDILHVGHIRYLKSAGKLGDKLVLGLISDSSVRKLKGKGRPVVPQSERAELLAEFPFIDYIVVFGEDTPYRVIKAILPDVLAKGGDWAPENIIGSDVVMGNGGKVKSLPYVKGRSTTNIIKKLLTRL